MSKQIISYNNGLDVLCGMVVHDLTIGDAFSQLFAKLQFYPGSTADFTDANVIGLHYGPGISNTRTVYVDKGGNDVDGDGSVLNPFLTINVALSAIADASPTKHYDVIVGPGTYTENIVLKPNVNLISQSPLSVTLVGAITIDAAWAATTGTCAMMFINFDAASSVVLDYETFAVTQSVIAMQSCVVNCGIDVQGHTLNNITVFRGCVLIGATNIVGSFPQLTGCFSAGATVDLQSAVGRPMQCFLLAVNGFGGLNVLSPALADPLSLTMINSPFQTTSFDGANVTVTATGNSLPVRSSVTVAGGAILTRFNDAYGLGYSPNAPGAWPVVPTNCQDALDYLADGQQSAVYAPVASNLIGITSVDSIDASYIAINGGITVSYVTQLTLPAIPSGICSYQMTLPINKVAAATRFEVYGASNISCDDGFGNLSISDTEFSSVQSIVGSSTDVLMRFSLGASASSTSIVIMGSFSYRQ